MNPEAFSGLSPFAAVLFGAVLLFFGRKLFWLFVAVVGFLFGLELGAQIMVGAEQWVVWLVALVIGLVGALLAVLLQRVAIILAGAAAGGLFLMNLAVAGGMNNTFQLAAFIVGAIVAGILAALLFDWALIILSAITGASLIAGAFTLSPAAAALVALALSILGIIFQARMRRISTTQPPAHGELVGRK